MIKLLMTFIIFVVLASPAAGAIVTADGSDSAPYEASLGHHMPLPATVNLQPTPGGCPFGPAPHPGGCTQLDNTGITVFLDPALASNVTAVTHEVGHVVDFTLGTPAIEGYDREKVADVWARCAIDGPNTLDEVVYTPSYSFAIPAAEYQADCATLRDKSLAAGWPDGTAAGSWRRQAVVGYCEADGYYKPCPRQQPQRRKWSWLSRWHWRR